VGKIKRTGIRRRKKPEKVPFLSKKGQEKLGGGISHKNQRHLSQKKNKKKKKGDIRKERGNQARPVGKKFKTPLRLARSPVRGRGVVGGLQSREEWW